MSVWLRSRLRHPSILLPQVKIVTQKILSLAGRSEGVVSLDFIGDRRMRRLNLKYCGKDAVTDVLAFAMQEAKGPATPLLGDVVISLHTAARQAVQYRIPFEHEVVRLIIHGILHLLGYDHERSERDARRMRRREQVILQALQPLPGLIEEEKTAR